MSVVDAFAVPGRVASSPTAIAAWDGPSPTLSASRVPGSLWSPATRAASETVLGELRAKGVDAEAFTADVRDRTALGAAAARVMDRFGAVDILVNNAGTCIHRPALEVTGRRLARGDRRQPHRRLEWVSGVRAVDG
jgi:NAD(P)-dependent dehydrogenase (short-subunit alcohol dehydrogenase family)